MHPLLALLLSLAVSPLSALPVPESTTGSAVVHAATPYPTSNAYEQLVEKSNTILIAGVFFLVAISFGVLWAMSEVYDLKREVADLRKGLGQGGDSESGQDEVDQTSTPSTPPPPFSQTEAETTTEKGDAKGSTPASNAEPPLYQASMSPILASHDEGESPRS